MGCLQFMLLGGEITFFFSCKLSITGGEQGDKRQEEDVNVDGRNRLQEN